MPQAVFKSVYAVSSEDPRHPASNLLRSQSGKKWRTKNAGEKSAYVVLQFDKSQKITGIDIGNEHSAFVEVLVGRNACSQEEFKEILITCSFMTPPESKTSTITNRVRFFDKEALVKSIAEEKWDLVKVVCTQPFNRHVQYGLAFITVHVLDLNDLPKDKVLVPLPSLQKENSKAVLVTSKMQKPEPNLKQIGSFKLREDSPDSESESSLSLFNRWKKSKTFKNDPKISTAASIRDASSPSSLKKNQDDFKPSIIVKSERKGHNRKDKNEDKPILDRNRNDLLFDKEDDNSNEKLEKKISEDQKRIQKENDEKKKEKLNVEKTSNSSFTKFKDKEKNSESKKQETETSLEANSLKDNSGTPNNNFSKKRNSSSAELIQSKKMKIEKPREFKPFNKLLQGVVLVISGIQNPDRADIRQKAIEMGARYKADWDNTCTHLICAFKNTPKYNQVKGHGKIVKRTWIEKCYSLKKRLPWRRYAIDTSEEDKSESEDEIYDVSLKPNMIDEDNTDISSHSQQTSKSPEKKSVSETNLEKEENVAVEVLPSSESDTEDELERVRNMQKKTKTIQKIPLELDDNESTKNVEENKDKKLTSPKKIKGNSNPNSVSVFDVSTEEEENTGLIEHKIKPGSRKFFKNMKFFIGNVTAIDEIKLKQFIDEYGGEIVQSITESDYAITKQPIQGSSKFKGEMVTPLWIYECNDMECLIPTRRYRL